MASQDGAQELVVLFDADASKIELEMRYGQFNGLLGQKATLGSHAGSTVKAAYVQVGAGLSVQAVVFFRFKVNDNGYVDPAFNLPLDYMAQHAGAGPDLGNGPISMASRSQCPIPWHAINMWEPSGSGENHQAMLVQKIVWRNRLGIKPVPMARRSKVSMVDARIGNAEDGRIRNAEDGRIRNAEDGRIRNAEDARIRNAEDGRIRNAGGARSRNQARRQLQDLTMELSQVANGTGATATVRALDEKLTARFGQSGRLSVTEYTQQHREQVGQVAEQFRTEMQRQQQSYLEQIKACRDEIQQLKASLRHERERNRRLQQLLRGDA